MRPIVNTRTGERGFVLEHSLSPDGLWWLFLVSLSATGEQVVGLLRLWHHTEVQLELPP